MITPNTGEYFRESPEEDEDATRAIYRLEIERLGLVNSKFIFPGNHVDIHVQYTEELKGSRATLRSKVFVAVGHDDEGNEIPGVSDMSYWGQTWDFGGCYLNPEMVLPTDII